ncbi:hypothetical protein [Oxalicibacterium solurbis]|uniref:Uncharacterized protein n=1 Tax=Oxalicibacterium solurbis TaxID=69280 RepID=A0A8J3B1A1_9BURK|nr:hypothetical protein [Oxalicibacterium solurbis]GGI53213.1 hypothetical protein GCM10011430_03870 [Oxalicibacterium solurbis]
MIKNQLDLRPAKEFSMEEKLNMPVSLATQPDGKTIVVSRFKDEVWDFYPYIPQENRARGSKHLDWRINLHDGSKLTDEQHKNLLHSSKEFIWSLFSEPVEGRSRAHMNTLIGKKESLIPLLRWMVKNGIDQFADLAGRSNEVLQVMRLKIDGHELAADSTVAKRLIMYESLFHQRDKIHDALQENPWKHETAVSLAGLSLKGDKRKPRTNFIPDEIVPQIANAAIEYVQVKSRKILAGFNSTKLAGEKVSSVKASSDRTPTNKTLKVAESKARTIAARNAGFKTSNALKTEVIRLRTACYIVICMFSGIRDSEMMSLGANCIVKKRSRDNTFDVIYMHGTIYKTGKRPKAWQVPPIVVEAVDVLKTLSAGMRSTLALEEVKINEKLGSQFEKNKAALLKRLDVVQRQKDKLFLARSYRVGAPISVLTGASMFKDLRNFCVSQGIRNKDGLPYPLHS